MLPSRAATSKNKTYRIGVFTLELPNLFLSLEGDSVAVTPKALETLRVLAESRGRVVSKQELLDAVWPETFVEEATLTQNIYTLRKILAADTERPHYIETVPRRGYRLTVPVEEMTADEEGRSGGAEVWIESMAVLPLEALASSEEMDLLGLGMADALITRLSTLRSLEVRPTSTILRLGREERNPEEVGRKLGVEAVLAGTVQKSGERLRVTVQLVHVERGTPLWGETFDTVYDDIFGVQDAISQRIAATLQLQLTRREAERMARPAASTTKAYEAYMRGRYLWNQRTFQGLERSIGSYRRALELDPSSALAYAGMADAYVLLPLYGDTPPREVFPKAREAASRALGLDPDLPEAHTALAYARFVFDWNWLEAEDGFRKALALNPNYATAHQWLSFLLTALGRSEEALEHARRARELDPLSRVISSDLGFVYYFSRRFEEAVAQHRSTLGLERGFAYAHFGMALAFAGLGRFEEAISEGREAVAHGDDSSAMKAVLGYVLARAGQRDEAREVLNTIGSDLDRFPHNASRLALVYAGLGEGEQALDLLERAWEQRSRFVAFLGVWEVYDGLRETDRFGRLLERVGLPRST